MTAEEEPPRSVLFACTFNAVRSVMAAGLMQKVAGPDIIVRSAGARAGMPDPFVMAVMDEAGIDVTEHEPRTFRDLRDEMYDLIVTLSPEAHHHAIELTRIMPARVEYWPTLDATVRMPELSRIENLARYRTVRDELHARLTQRFAPALRWRE